MTSRDFCYWLQGYFEIHTAGTEGMKVDQGLVSEKVRIIQRHLAMVFEHDIDPSFGGPEKQAVLDHLHHQGKPGEPVMRC